MVDSSWFIAGRKKQDSKNQESGNKNAAIMTINL